MLDFLSRFDFFSRLFKKNEEPPPSKIAKDRLRMVLIHDRTSVSSSFLEDLKADLFVVFNKYMEIDETGMEILLDRKDGTVALAANIPILKIRPNPLPGPKVAATLAQPSITPNPPGAPNGEMLLKPVVTRKKRRTKALAKRKSGKSRS